MYICVIVSIVDVSDCIFCLNEQQKVYMFGTITGPDERIYCQQLDEWLVDKSEGSVDVPCLCFWKKLELLCNRKYQMSRVPCFDVCL